MANVIIIGLGLLILVICIVWNGNLAGECNTLWGSINQAISAEMQNKCSTQTTLSQVGMGLGIIIAGYGFFKNK